jgi:hypothetical protein
MTAHNHQWIFEELEKNSVWQCTSRVTHLEQPFLIERQADRERIVQHHIEDNVNIIGEIRQHPRQC